MAKFLDTLEFPLEITDDYERARSLEDIMRAIEDVLRNGDEQTQDDELIGEYLRAWGEHNDLTGAINVIGRGINTYLPSQYTVDLVTAAYGES